MRKMIAIAAICAVMPSFRIPAARAADPCDRACLERHVDKVFEAVINSVPYGMKSEVWDQ